MSQRKLDPLPWPGRLFNALQYVLPHHALSKLAYWATRWRWRPWKNLLITTVTRAFQIDLSEAVYSHRRDYPHFNAFFTRALRPEARPVELDPQALVSPVDGSISQIGAIEADRMLQAKGRWFSLATLLGGAQPAAPFNNGLFTTIYLSPRDYHRIHMPIEGQLLNTHYIPGRLFSVQPTTTAGIDCLFTRNERLVCHFDTAVGPLCLVLVGAIMVSSIETVWGGITRPRRQAQFEDHWQQQHRYAQGQEIARFNMGSTVILISAPNTARWCRQWQPDQAIRMGQTLARCDGSTSPEE